MKRLPGLMIVVFLVTGCGNYGHWYVEWPARLTEISNFSEDQQKSVIGIIEELNTQTGRTLISVDAGEGSSAIEVRWVKNLAKMATTVAGRATIEVDRCTIEIVDIVATNPELLKPVLWHEIGHCAGLDHSPEKGQIMYKEVTPLSQLTSSEIGFFLAQIEQATINK